jgi:ABC-type branched-subunit amino acid transport system substrate-binding protein
MPLVSGLFVSLSIFALSCTTVGAAVDTESGPTEPALQPGSVDSTDQAESDRLLAEAQAALDAGNFSRAEELALQVVSSYATARGSSSALWIRAQAAAAMGKAEEALPAIRRFRTYLSPDDDRRASVAILEGDALAAMGRTVEAVGVWAAAPAGSEDDLVLGRISEQVGAFSEDELEVLADSAGPHVAPILAELALKRYAVGALADAQISARRALAAGAAGRARRIAEGVLSGDMTEFLIAPVIGAILPMSGSPRLREFAELIQEGIRIALEQFGQAEGNRAATELVIQDNGGVVGNAPRLLAALESSSALGVIGPLQDGALADVASRRQGLLAMISPTAPIVPEGAEGVYSLAGDDPGASQALAHYAMDSDLQTAVVMYPESRDATLEARSFVEAFESLGGSVLREFVYPAGATFFGEQLQEVDSLRPAALVLPLPVRDVELMAPQVTFYGLDSLEIRVLGTAGWTDEEMLARVATRHTNGVVSASPQPPDGEPEGYRRFVDAYEAYHQRTLPSAVPALGYDAAALLLEGIRMGANTPSQLLTNLENISGLSGATGVFSVEDGRVVREHFVICLQDRRVQAVPDRARAEPILLPPLPDPETDSIPEGAPDRIVGFRCPSFSPPAPPGR